MEQATDQSYTDNMKFLHNNDSTLSQNRITFLHAKVLPMLAHIAVGRMPGEITVYGQWTW